MIDLITSIESSVLYKLALQGECIITPYRMGVYHSWLVSRPDKSEVTGSSPVTPTILLYDSQCYYVMFPQTTHSPYHRSHLAVTTSQE